MKSVKNNCGYGYTQSVGSGLRKYENSTLKRQDT